MKCPEGSISCFFSSLNKNYSDTSVPPIFTEQEYAENLIDVKSSLCNSSYALNFLGVCEKCREECDGCSYLGTSSEDERVNSNFFYLQEKSQNLTYLQEKAKIFEMRCLDCRNGSFLNSTTRKCQICPSDCKLCDEYLDPITNTSTKVRCLECKFNK